MNKKGQPRKGGMPVGHRKPEGVRSMRSLKAYDDEWQIIKAFAAQVKHGDRHKCEQFLSSVTC